jgi:hypothetical protein
MTLQTFTLTTVCVIGRITKNFRIILKLVRQLEQADYYRISIAALPENNWISPGADQHTHNQED